ncbi:MAG: hypothetical protein LC733_05385 [Actinobacteria bacterium]|nr:hypothetical protein [Actinomycetota bacterium]
MAGWIVRLSPLRRRGPARAVLVATVGFVLASSLSAPPAGADVTSVESSAFGVLVTPPGTTISLNEQPAVSFSNPPGPAGTNNASQALAQSPPTGNPPGLFFNAQGMAVTMMPVV